MVTIKYLAFLVLNILMVSSLQARITVKSLEELLPYLDDDNVDVVVKAGTYTITAKDVKEKFGSPRFVFKGNGSTYDFTGVTINFAKDVYTENLGMDHLQTLGNDNVIKNLTMVDLVEKNIVHKKNGGQSIVLDGKNNRIEGFHVTVRGSFPYGYGDAFGKGGKTTIKHKKHSACLVRGESNHVKNCTFIHRSYGHCIFMQAADKPLIEGCTIEGEMRTTDDILTEKGSGSPADKIDFQTIWGYRLPPNYILSTGEGGIRAYNAGATTINGEVIKRGTSNPTVKDCTIKHMRTGIALAHATGKVQVSNCTTIGCEQGFQLGKGNAIACKSDLSHGHAFKSTYEKDKWDMDIEIIPAVDPYYNGQKCIAFIGMDKSTLNISGGDPKLPKDYRIQIGGTLNGIRFLEGSLAYQSTHNAMDSTIINKTKFPIEIDSGSKNNTIKTKGKILGEKGDNKVSK